MSEREREGGGGGDGKRKSKGKSVEWNTLQLSRKRGGGVNNYRGCMEMTEMTEGQRKREGRGITLLERLIANESKGKHNERREGDRDRETGRESEREREREREREGETDRQTDRQIERQTDIQRQRNVKVFYGHNVRGNFKL